LTEAQHDTRGAKDPLALSVSHCVTAELEKLLESTLPAKPGQGWKCLFKLARKLKGVPALSLDDGSIERVRAVVAEWHRRSQAVLGASPFVDTWAVFVTTWDKVRFPEGCGPLASAWRLAKDSREPTRSEKLYGDGPIVLLEKLCRELQRLVGDHDFFLDCRTAGKLLGVNPMRVWRYLDVLCKDRVLRPGAKGSLAAKKASCFRYLGASGKAG
jgi:hypothetical protein